MKINKFKLKYLLILLLPAGMLLNIFSISNNKIVEEYYSISFYKWFSQVLSSITGLLPFSLAEAVLICLILFLIYIIIKYILKRIRGKLIKQINFRCISINILIIISILYFSFQVMWGLNYNRQSIGDIFNLNVKPATQQELVKICTYLINEANTLRNKQEEDEQGVMYLRDGYRDVFKRASLGYKIISSVYPTLSGKYGNPKPLILSELMSYTGIWGIYIPFTGEANVNIDIPPSFIPAIACHELAHQRGIAREDEANYIAYLTCVAHEDIDFQYSGTMLALLNSLNALGRDDPKSYQKLKNKLSADVLRDFQSIDDFNNEHNCFITDISTKSNDLYLKANNQKDGEQSYGKVVDLLVADYRKNNKF